MLDRRIPLRDRIRYQHRLRRGQIPEPAIPFVVDQFTVTWVVIAPLMGSIVGAAAKVARPADTPLVTLAPPCAKAVTRL